MGCPTREMPWSGAGRGAVKLREGILYTDQMEKQASKTRNQRTEEVEDMGRQAWAKLPSGTR